MKITVKELEDAAYCPFLPRLNIKKEDSSIVRDVVETYIYIYSKFFYN